jgi:hypothetical protein
MVLVFAFAATLAAAGVGVASERGKFTFQRDSKGGGGTQIPFNFSQAPTESGCFGACDCDECVCYGSFECCVAGCIACWDYGDTQPGFCEAT